MKFLKENLTLVICAAVAVLLLVAAFFWPIPGWLEQVKTDMKARAAVKGVILTAANTKLPLPGLPEQKGVPSKEYVAARKQANEAIAKQKESVEQAGRIANARGRLSATKHPLLPAPLAADGVVEEIGFLPHLQGDALKYKADYMSQFRLWTGWLLKGVPGNSELDASMPPDPNAMKIAWDEQVRIRQSQAPAAMANLINQNDTVAFNNYQKQQVTNKASDHRMYVERYAFQVRGFAATDSPPSELDIFESLVDSWLQSDIVKAIVATNDLANPNKTDTNVNRSSVKRLTRIIVGNNARNKILSTAANTLQTSSGPVESGPLFLTTFNATLGLGGTIGTPIPVAGGGAAPADVPMTPNEIHYELGMSGRSGGADYDIVMMNVLVDIDPAKLNTFIDQVYRQNMGYSVSNISIKTVDPLERASTGYLYGDGQVVEAEIQFECLLFRGWTLPIMPDAERALLGLPPNTKAP